MVNKLTIDHAELVRRLEHSCRSGRKVRMVLDTDTYNEIDDQFAVVYTLLASEKLQPEAFYAAPFFNELSTGPKDGMEKSYDELNRILGLMQAESIPSFRGSEQYLPAGDQPVDSPAARDLAARARASSPEDPLYVVAIGAITNVASALLLAPDIIDRIVIVWLGGHALNWHTTHEFNLMQDVHSARVVFDSGAPVVLIPCMGVASHLQTSLSEIRDYVKPSGAIGAYLYETYKRCRDDHFAYSRVIWDISAIAYLVNPDWTPSSLVHSPLLSDDCRWSVDTSRHLIRYVHGVNRDAIFKDLFLRLRQAAE